MTQASLRAKSIPATADTFANGSVLAEKYFVHRTIGEGGIGVVVAATHLHLEQQVAIKFLNARAREKPALIERFMHEAKLSAMVRSNHSVRIYDVSRTRDGMPYMVMELLEGEDLAGVLRHGALPVARAVDYVLQACEALAEAHSIGIVHRDLKPENMFLAHTPRGGTVLKVLDFGISKLIEREPGESRTRVKTQVAECFGTPMYMSPEQLRSSAQVDSRTDIWAMGVVLFELMTGKLPFDAPSLPQLCFAVAGEPHARLRDAVPDAPPELEAIVDRCLEKDPDNRFRNVAELAQALAPFGPQAAISSAEQVARIVRGQGLSLRPPVWDGEDAAPLLLLRPSGKPTLDELEVVPSKRPTKKKIAWGVAAMVAAIGVVSLGIAKGRAQAPESGYAIVVAAPLPPAAIAPASAEVPIVVAPVVAAAPVDVQNATIAAPRPKRAPKAAAAPLPVAAPPSLAPEPVQAGADRRAVFGDRQ